VSHLEPERLVLLALGEETLDQHETGHLDSCERCRAHMDELRDVAGLGRQTQRLRELPPPPEHVWQRIRAELASSGRALPPPAVALHTDPPAMNGFAGGAGGAPAPQPRRGDDAPRHAAPEITGEHDELAPRRAARRQRAPRPRWPATVAIAAAAAVLAVGATVLVLRDRAPATPSAACPAGAPKVRLEALPGSPAGVSASACLVTVDGDRKLLVHAEGMPAQPDGDYEAWLLDSTSLDGPSLRMQALGVMGSQPNQELTVPETLDLSKFDIVDISVEPHDGNAAHSGHSVLRGTLP